MTKKSRKASTITGVDANAFENFIQAGTSLGASANQDLSINRTKRKSAKTEVIPVSERVNAPSANKKNIGGSLGFAPRREISTEERFERANLLNISQQDLDNLATNFTQRRSQVIGRRQQPGRNQLILTRDNL